MSALDFEANKATLRTLNQFRIVHFSTHGILDDFRPELSALVLSLVDTKGQPLDGFLRLHEVYELVLPAELVVLNACESGASKRVAGEGLVGLGRTFMYAGARAVAAALWRVGDEPSAALMGELYRGMLGPSRLGAASALRSR